MKCPVDPNGVHLLGGDCCTRCHAPVPRDLVESRDQPWREPIRAKAGAGAYGKTAEADALDVARRRAGDDS